MLPELAEDPEGLVVRGTEEQPRRRADPVQRHGDLRGREHPCQNNNITDGTLTFTVPAAAQNYRYRCTTHEFGNVIQTVP